MERKIVNLDSVEKYNHLVGLETLHPLITVADLNHATKSFEEMRWNYGLYAIFLKMELACTIQYGRQNYDYQEGTECALHRDKLSMSPALPAGPRPMS